MNSESFQYTAAGGWSCGSFPAMDSEQTLVMVFGASRLPDLEPRIAELRAAYPNSVLMGCSTAGEIFGTELFDESLSVAVMRFEQTQLRVVSADCDARTIGSDLAAELADPGLRAVFVLAEGLDINGSRLAEAFSQGLPDHVTVTGGLAGDGSAFEKTWILDEDRPSSNRITAVGFYGKAVDIHFGYFGGWQIFGPERRVTRSEGNVLYELDGKPALDIYTRYLGDLAEGLPGTGLLFPLQIQPGRDEEPLVRTILAIDHERKSLTFAGDIPEGSIARLMRSNLDEIIEGAASASAGCQPASGDAVSLAISCVGRRLILEHRTEEEIEGVLSNLPGNTRQIGFYSYGELAPWGRLPCGLHNQTMTLTVISERAAA